MTLTSTRKGDITVAMITARLLQLEYDVLRPVSEDSRYDLVIDRGEGFKKVQCKTGRMRRGAVEFNTVSISAPHRGGKGRQYTGEVDFFGVYCPDTDRCYLVPADKVPKRIGVLRVIPSRNNQQKRVVWAKDFLL